MSSVEKAMISVCNDEGVATGDHFYVQFNPNKITINEHTGSFANKKTRRPEKGAVTSQSSPAEVQVSSCEESRSITFTTTLFFNTYNSAADCSDVRPLVSKFDQFLNKKEKINVSENHIPVRIRFAWGSIQVFGLLTSMSVSYTMFSPAGLPVRAEASITITGDYVKCPTPPKQETVPYANKSVGFAGALAAYGSISALKIAAQASGVVNLRLLT